MSDNDSFYSISGSDSSDDDEFYQKSNLSLLMLSFMMINTKFYNIYLFKESRDFIENIITWTYNNPLNLKHVKKIKEQLLKEPFLTGVFSVVKLNNDKVYLIDGHHRHRALLELYTEGKLDEDIPVEVHCYESDTIKSQKTINLFQKLNHTKPFQVDIEINILALRIIDFMEKTFPNAIRELVRRSYPNIRKKELNDALQNRIQETKNFSYEKIIRNISRENGEYHGSARQLVQKAGKNWFEINKKLKKTGCYLGLVDVKTWVNRVIKFV